MEKTMDRVRMESMENIGRETPFGDHVIYAHIIKFMIVDRWNTLDEQIGKDMLKDIIEG